MIGEAVDVGSAGGASPAAPALQVALAAEGLVGTAVVAEAVAAVADRDNHSAMAHLDPREAVD